MRDRILASPARNGLVAVLGEFLGTFMFLLFGFISAQTTVLNTRALDLDTSPEVATLAPLRLLYIAIAFGTALAVNVWIFYRVTGGMFNPAVSHDNTL